MPILNINTGNEAGSGGSQTASDLYAAALDWALLILRQAFRWEDEPAVSQALGLPLRSALRQLQGYAGLFALTDVPSADAEGFAESAGYLAAVRAYEMLPSTRLVEEVEPDGSKPTRRDLSRTHYSQKDRRELWLGQAWQAWQGTGYRDAVTRAVFFAEEASIAVARPASTRTQRRACSW